MTIKSFCTESRVKYSPVCSQFYVYLSAAHWLMATRDLYFYLRLSIKCKPLISWSEKSGWVDVNTSPLLETQFRALCHPGLGSADASCLWCTLCIWWIHAWALGGHGCHAELLNQCIAFLKRPHETARDAAPYIQSSDIAKEFMYNLILPTTTQDQLLKCGRVKTGGKNHSAELGSGYSCGTTPLIWQKGLWA